MTTLASCTALVTGAGGFVGPHLVRALAARGARVHGVGLGRPRADVPLERWTELDLVDGPALAEAFAASRPDVIVHLAGQSSAGRSFEIPAETFRANVVGTWRLLDATRDAAPKARVIVVSTSEIYGPQPHGSRAAETSGFRPVSPYGSSKAAADQLAAAYADAYRLDILRARPFGHIGPGQDARFAIPAWAQQLAAIEAGQAEPVLRVGNLDVTRDLSDVRDVVQGYCALIERGRAGAAYNLCRGEGVKLDDVVRRLVEMSSVPVRIEADPARMRPADLPYLVGDPTRMLEDCGWRATTALERSLREVLDESRGRAA